MSFPLSSQGKIFRWQDISPFGKILDGAIRVLDRRSGRLIEYPGIISYCRELNDETRGFLHA